MQGEDSSYRRLGQRHCTSTRLRSKKKIADLPTASMACIWHALTSAGGRSNWYADPYSGSRTSGRIRPREYVSVAMMRIRCRALPLSAVFARTLLRMSVDAAGVVSQKCLHTPAHSVLAATLSPPRP